MGAKLKLSYEQACNLFDLFNGRRPNPFQRMADLAWAYLMKHHKLEYWQENWSEPEWDFTPPEGEWRWDE